MDGGHTEVMDPSDRLWLEAHAHVQSALDADVREEAYEMFLVEAARCRLSDRRGPAQVTLRCGLVLRGVLSGEARADEHLCLGDETSMLLISVEAVVCIIGSGPALRREGGGTPSLASCLRTAWSEAGTVRALLADGGWRSGEIDFVGADHVTLRTADALVTVPMRAVEAWQLD